MVIINNWRQPSFIRFYSFIVVLLGVEKNNDGGGKYEDVEDEDVYNDDDTASPKWVVSSDSISQPKTTTNDMHR